MSSPKPPTPMPTPTPRPRTTVCPYCGHISASISACERCRGLFEPLSRQASQNNMGPWFIRDEASPFLPGCSIQTLRALIRRGKVTRETILRGPSTRQFWTFARNAPGIANLLGECHACHSDAAEGDDRCNRCGASFAVLEDRERLGLSDVRLLPGRAAPELIAAASGSFNTRPEPPSGSENGHAHAATDTRPTAIDFPHDAQTLIAASQRRKRDRQRITMAVVFACTAIAAAAGTVMFVMVNRQGSPQKKSPPSNPVKSVPTAQPTPTSDPPAEPTLEVPADPPLVSTESNGKSGKTPYSDVIAKLTSSDLKIAAAALASVTSDDLQESDELLAAVRVAEARLRSARIGTRL